MNEKLEIKNDGFYLGGKPYYLASGDIHHFRIYPTRMAAASSFGKGFRSEHNTNLCTVEFA